MFDNLAYSFEMLFSLFLGHSEIITFYPDSPDPDSQSGINDAELKVSKLFTHAAFWAVINQKCLLQFLQEKWDITYLEASEIISNLECALIIGYGEFEGSNRDVFFSLFN